MGLVLHRKLGESVTIEGVGTITVRRCTENGCKLVFNVPESINIARTELLVAEQPVQGSSQDDERMDCEGHDAPFSYDHAPLLVGKFGP